jgi:hypothetical protein
MTNLVKVFYQDSSLTAIPKIPHTAVYLFWETVIRHSSSPFYAKTVAIAVQG